MSTSIATVTSTLIFTLGAAALIAGPASANIAPKPAHETHGTIYSGPTRLLGEHADLTIKNGVLSGHIAGGIYNLRIEGNTARGAGPLGLIDVTLVRGNGGFQVSGVWNGGRIRFEVGDRAVRGRAERPLAAGDTGYANCRYDLGRRADERGYSGRSECADSKKTRYFEVLPQARAGLTEEQNVILLLAYLTAPSTLSGM